MSTKEIISKLNEIEAVILADTQSASEEELMDLIPQRAEEHLVSLRKYFENKA